MYYRTVLTIKCCWPNSNRMSKKRKTRHSFEYWAQVINYVIIMHENNCFVINALLGKPATARSQHWCDEKIKVHETATCSRLTFCFHLPKWKQFYDLCCDRMHVPIWIRLQQIPSHWYFRWSYIVLLKWRRILTSAQSRASHVPVIWSGIPSGDMIDSD